MIESSGDSQRSGSSVAKRRLTVVWWLWVGLFGFFAMLAGMMADGCSDAACDSGIAKAWLVLLAAQALIIAGGLALRRRLGSTARLGVLAGVAVVSPLTVVAFSSYVSRFF